MNCTLAETEQGCVCEVCGWIAPNNGNPCNKHRRNCPGSTEPRDALAKPCKHFLGFTGRDIPADKDCGCKTAEPMTASAECELHGICTVVQLAADKSIPCCERCDDYQKE